MRFSVHSFCVFLIFLPKFGSFYSITVFKRTNFLHERNEGQLDCLERLVYENDIWSKVASAPIVFRGSIVAKSQKSLVDRSTQVTFRIETVFKGKSILRKLKHLRLKYWKEQTADLNPTDLESCRIGARIRIRKDYLVYVDRIGSMKLVPHSKPDRWDKSTQKIVRKFENCQACVQAPNLKKVFFAAGSERHARTYSATPTTTESPSRDVKIGDRVHMRCNFQESIPQPTLVWLKDGHQISTEIEIDDDDETKIRISTKRKKSSLVLDDFSASDVGEYVCVASSILGNSSAQFNIQDEKSQVKKGMSQSWWHSESESVRCPIHDYCLNQGSCIFYKSIEEMVCLCAEGYNGKRCELKNRPKITKPAAKSQDAFCDFSSCK